MGSGTRIFKPLICSFENEKEIQKCGRP